MFAGNRGRDVSTLRAQTHQTDITELVAMKADCRMASCHLCLGQKVAPEHTAKASANSQLV